MRGLHALLLAAVAVACLPGCSFLLVRRAPANEPSGEIPCTVSYGWPVADGVLSGLWVGEVGVAAFAVQEDTVKTRVEVGGMFAALALMQAVSAYYGAATVARCRDAQVEALNRGIGLQATAHPSVLSPPEGGR